MNNCIRATTIIRVKQKRMVQFSITKTFTIHLINTRRKPHSAYEAPMIQTENLSLKFYFLGCN